MQLVKRSLPVFLLAGIFALSLLDLSGWLAAGLFLLVAFVLSALARRSGFLFSAVMLVIVAFVLAYPMEVLLYDFQSGPRLVSFESLEFGTLWALRGFCAFAIGYSLVIPLAPGPQSRSGQGARWVRGRISYAVYIVTAIGWLAVLSWALSVALFGISLTFVEGDAVSVDSAAGTLRQILGLMASLKHPFLLGFLVLYFWRMTDRHLALLFVSLVGISVVEIVTIGSKGSIIRGVVTVLLAGSVLPMRLTIRQAAAAAAASIAVYGSFLVITEYRALILAEHEAGRNVFDIALQAETFGRALIASVPFVEAGASRETEVKTDDVFRRLGHGATFARLLEDTGRESPHEHAWESLLAPVYAVVPRFLLSDKPEYFHSGRNASEYYGWEYGGISVTLLGSFYYAWGYLGILFGMACVGGWLALVEARARQRNILSPHWLVLFAPTVLMLLDVGVTFQPILTDLVRLALLLLVLQFFYPALKRSMRQRASRVLSPRQGSWRT